MFIRNQASLRQHARKLGENAYRNCTYAIREEFNSLCDILPEQFQNGTNVALTQITDDFSQMVQNHTLQYDQKTNDSQAADAKASLQKEFALITETLMNSWKRKVEIKIEQMDDEEVEILAINDDEEGSAADSDDDSSEAGTDEDGEEE